MTVILGRLIALMAMMMQLLVVTSGSAYGQPDPIISGVTDTTLSRDITEHYGRLPLPFEPNQGQTDRQVSFLTRGNRYTLFLAKSEAVFVFRGDPSAKVTAPSEYSPQAVSAKLSRGGANDVLRMKLLGANEACRILGEDELAGKANYFIGNDPSKWRTALPNYSKIKYEGVYPGVDLFYYGNFGRLEYDFVVSAGVNPNVIQLEFEGLQKPRIDEHGALVLQGRNGDLRFEPPQVYQKFDGIKHSVEGRYLRVANNAVGFVIGKYDHSRPLIIDPVLNYSTYLGGSKFEEAWGIAVDTAGNAYVAGWTSSVDFPLANPILSSATALSIFVTKFNSSGTTLVYSTFLGPANASNFGPGFIAVDPAGNAYVTGFTGPGFPTINALQPAYGGGISDAFVTKINPTGSALIYSTYLGGSGTEFGLGVAADTAGNAYVTGEASLSPNFPVANAFQSTCPTGAVCIFLSKINPSGAAFVYSTYLGGSAGDRGTAIAADSLGNAYVTGTAQVTLPATSVLQLGTGSGTFAAKINPTGSALPWAVHLRTNLLTEGHAIAVDSLGNVLIAGITDAPDLPVVNALQPTLHGLQDAFVTKINPTGSALIYSTYLGGGGNEFARGIATDSAGNAYVTGPTDSTDFPTANAVQATPGGGGDAFIAELNSNGSALVYSTYLGGSGAEDGHAIAVDSTNNTYVAGSTFSTDFPTIRGFQLSATHETAFVAKISTVSFGNISPSVLAFNEAVGGTTGAQVVTLSNMSAQLLNISGIAISGVNPSDFSDITTCGTSLAAGASCTISVTFSPTAIGVRRGTVDISSSAVGSPESVVLVGNASVPLIDLSAAALTFGNQLVNTTSGAQTVSVSNPSKLPLTVSSIGVAGVNPTSFSQVNTCSTVLVPGASCSINVRFTASSPAIQTASLSFVLDGGQSSQSVALSGNGTDFSVGPVPGAPTSGNFAAGQSAALNLQVNPISGFTGAVSLACTGAPALSTCTVSPASVNLSGTSPALFTVTVMTTARGLVMPGPSRRHDPLDLIFLLVAIALLPLLIAALRVDCTGHSGRPRYAILSAGLMVCFALLAVGCGGGGGGGGGGGAIAGTPAGTYSLTVTGTQQGVNRTANLTLTIN